MTEGLPTNIPTSLAHGPDPSEQKDFPSGHPIDSPRGWHAKATLSEPRGSASTSLSQNCSRTLGRLSSDEAYNGFSFTFPRLHLGLVFEKDPFIDSRGVLLNPHNTPISQSGHQSEIGLCEKDKRHAPSSIKSDKRALGRLGNTVRSDDSPLTSISSGSEATWRPPKPSKPSLLSGIDILLQRETENAQPSSSKEKPPSGGDEKALPETPPRSLPLRASQNFNRRVEHSATDRGPDRRPARQKQSWETQKVASRRLFPPQVTPEDWETLSAPLKNPKMPYPARIPNVDNLPLRRGAVDSNREETNQYQIDDDNSSRTEPNRPGTRKESLSGILWQLARNLFKFEQLKMKISHYFNPWKQDGPDPKKMPPVRTSVTIPSVLRRKTRPGEQRQVSAGLVDGAYILQIDLTLPLLSVNRTASLAAHIHRRMSSKIVLMAAFLVRDLIKITTLFLLYVFGIDVSIEVKRIDEANVER